MSRILARINALDEEAARLRRKLYEGVLVNSQRERIVKRLQEIQSEKNRLWDLRRDERVGEREWGDDYYPTIPGGIVKMRGRGASRR